MLTKIIPVGSHPEALFQEPATALIKVASNGLGDGGADGLKKRSGSIGADWARWVKQAMRTGELRPGEVPVHVIAMGAFEKFAQNRNFDAFSRRMLEATCHTFVSDPEDPLHSGWCFRSHKNDFRKHAHYGRIVKAAYNRDMDRVELIHALYGTREAAGHPRALIADQEQEDLAKYGSYDTSMAVRLAFDRCSGCSNEAPDREHYCREGDFLHKGKLIKACQYGGLHANIGRMFDDGHVLHADNPLEARPYFFDDSHVGRRADRIALAIGDLRKVASAAGSNIGGAQLADELGIVAPRAEWRSDATMGPLVEARVRAALDKVAAAESELASGPIAADLALLGMGRLPGGMIDLARQRNIGYFQEAMKRAHASWPLADFVRYTCADGDVDEAAVWEKVADLLPGAWDRLSDEIVEAIADWLPAGSAPGDFLASVEKRAHAACSVSPECAKDRTLAACCAGITTEQLRFVKRARAGIPEAEALAAHYCASRLAAVMDDINDGRPGVARLLAAQNFMP